MLPDTFYHVYTHANGSENLFRTDDNYGYFLKRYAHFVNSVADTYAYCLMPNHVHFLVKVKTEEELMLFWKEKYPGKVLEEKTLEVFENLQGLVPQQFGNLFNGYTKAFNKVHKRKGSLFMQNFKRKPVENDSYFTKLVHYIHANPVHHGFVNNLSDWSWSSYQAFLFDKPTKLRRQEVLDWFGGKEDLLALHQQPIDVKLGLEMDF